MFNNIRRKNYFQLLKENKAVTKNLLYLLIVLALVNMPTNLKILSAIFSSDHKMNPSIDLFMHSHPILLTLQIFSTMLLNGLIVLNLIKLYQPQDNNTVVSKDSSLLIEETIETTANKNDNSFLFHKIHGQVLAEKIKE